MPKNTIVHADKHAKLRIAPINPAWILEGDPVARNIVLSRSDDTTACTIMWDCTAGRFNWHYSFDETIHIVEGSVIVSSQHSPPRRLETGDVAFFPLGTVAEWRVETYVRKVAFCRHVLPIPALPAVMRTLRKARKLLRGRAKTVTGSLMEA